MPKGLFYLGLSRVVIRLIEPQNISSDEAKLRQLELVLVLLLDEPFTTYMVYIMHLDLSAVLVCQ